MEEVKHDVFVLNRDTASGPDGFISQFYPSCWDIIFEDVVDMIRAFSCGSELPRFIAGFVKGRSIVKNIMLTQEIVTDIRKRGMPSNVVIQLDMAKAYDRLSWLFLTKVLRQMGFGEIFIDMIF
ncbi:uncharacterized protein LOC142174392 [Nicotiana tabacum]|uniref:Uncharacterized protein LOC142174392 n=1 Tax=Nicotiana tabacum TaxID=4097 RepID=A0AC58TGC9_TOBAC